MLSTRRTRRRPTPRGSAVGLAVGVVTAAILATGVVPALAVGASGVDVSPELPRDGDGSFVLTVEDRPEGEEATLVLRNLADEPRDGRVYAAAAALPAGGGVDVGAAGSVPWLPLDEPFSLAPGERLRLPLELQPRRADLAGDGDDYIALVLEVTPSASLVTQAVTIVRVRTGAIAPLPTWPLVVAVVLLVAAVLALARFGRRRPLVHSGAEER